MRFARRARSHQDEAALKNRPVITAPMLDSDDNRCPVEAGALTGHLTATRFDFLHESGGPASKLGHIT